MKSDGAAKHVIFAFVLALVLYLAGFHLIESCRESNGPWHVKFQSDLTGRPSIVASHEKFRLSDVALTFPDMRIDQTNVSQSVVFDKPITNIPFGRVIYLDTTFLPGAITMHLFGHEIELLPRVLVINRKEVPWKSETTIELLQKDKLQ
ncbi:MAG: hypothetical protein FJ403_03435 [Verrucomicrobia bacterium]|nr:hypothetical protein [Verrucomicrobiota bacterium]